MGSSNKNEIWIETSSAESANMKCKSSGFCLNNFKINKMHRSSAGNVTGRVGGSSTYDGKIAGLYDLEQTLGSGHFAVVKLARHVFTGEKVAVKVIDKSKLDEMSRSHLFQEVRCMKLVQHPNVVRLYEVIDTQTKLYLILELGDGGDLYDIIMRHESGLSETLARDYFRQIVRAISYCHRLHVVHRDLKPENVVFFERLGIVKLTDFGFSNKFCPGQKLETSCGSLAYSAPEILLGDSYDAPAVDVWSLGVILYMLVCGQAPFHEANDSETLTMIMDCKYSMPQHISAACKKLIGRMLVRQPEKRATLSEITDDPWLAEGCSANAERPDDVPLVSKQHLSDEDRTLIVQKMVSGHIATKEQILDALEKDSYNHITATYFLLAERKLRAQRQEILQLSTRASALVSQQSPGEHAPAYTPHLLQLPAPCVVPSNPTGDIPARTRKCSIVREEDDDEDGVTEEVCIDSADADTRRGSRSEGRLNMAVLAARPDLPPDTPPILSTPIPSTTLAPVDRLHAATTVPLTLAAGITKVNLKGERLRSAPVFNPPMALSNMPGWMSFGKKLNCFGDHIRPKSAIEHGSVNNNISISAPISKIKKPIINITKVDGAKAPLPLLNEDEVSCENMVAEFACAPLSTSRVAPPAPPPPRRHRLDCRRRRSRASSCSSSDLSDEDSSESGRKKRSPSEEEQRTDCAPTLRRDSHDDSSDSQERGAAGGAGRGMGCETTTRASAATRPPSGGGGGSGNNDNVSKGKGCSGGGGRSGGADDIPRRHRRGGGRRETRLRESRSLNRITEVAESTVVTNASGTESSVRWAVRGGLAALCGRPFLKLISRRGELIGASPACQLHAQQCCGLC